MQEEYPSNQGANVERFISFGEIFMPRPNTKTIANVDISKEELQILKAAKEVQTISIALDRDVYEYCKENRVNISGTVNYMIRKIQQTEAANA